MTRGSAPAVDAGLSSPPTARPGEEASIAAAADIAVEAARHGVHFYTRDAELVETVGRYIAEALRSGGAAVVVASGAHLRAFEDQCDRAGVDLRAAREAGAYRAFDAARMLRRFVHDGRPDRDRFEASIGIAIRAAGASGRPLSVYGEMVSLLWDAGMVAGAIELEELWIELGRDVRFSLLCSYRSEAVAGEEHGDAVHELCRLHSHVTSSPQVADSSPWLQPFGSTRSFTADLEAPRAARGFVRATLATIGAAAELVDDALLVVSEFATNAVVHARSDFAVTVTASSATVRIEVRDAGSRSCVATRPVPRPTHGLGIVAAIATAWGADPGSGGIVAWAELRRH